MATGSIEVILESAEPSTIHCWPVENHEIKAPFPRITYNEAMEQYGCDKPDTRFGLLVSFSFHLYLNNKP